MTEGLLVPSPHGSHRHSASGAGRGRLLVVLALVVGYLLVEVIGSLLTNSLALLADAGHMLTDAVGVALALLAIQFAARPATAAKSYGYYRLEILAAVANAVLLFGVAAYILFEAYQRFNAPPDVQSLPMLGVAAVGLVVNLVSMRLLSAGAETSLNLRGAYLEVLGDFLGSVAVMVAAVVILTTGFAPADSIASVVIALLILPRTWSLLREAVDVLLQATPKGGKPRRGASSSSRRQGRGRCPRSSCLGADIGHERRFSARDHRARRGSGKRSRRNLCMPVG